MLFCINFLQVVGEHDGKSITPSTLSTITAASKLGQEISLLLAGHNIGDVAKAAASIKGPAKVITVDDEVLAHASAEDLSKLLVPMAKNYSHILAPSSNVGKNFMPRLAALLDVSPLTDVLSVVDNETFKRPMYAGNAIATVKMTDSIKVFMNFISLH